MENQTVPNQTAEFDEAPPPALPAGEDQQFSEPQELTAEQKRALIFIIIALILLVVITIGSIIFLLNQPPRVVAQIRDVFIIFMALQSLLTGVVLVILIVQMARLLNLLQNELGPLLDSLNVTISNLRGTTVFLTENLTEPVIKMNQYLAGLSQLFSVLGLLRRPSRNKTPKGE